MQNVFKEDYCRSNLLKRAWAVRPHLITLPGDDKAFNQSTACRTPGKQILPNDNTAC